MSDIRQPDARFPQPPSRLSEPSPRRGDMGERVGNEGGDDRLRATRGQPEVGRDPVVDVPPDPRDSAVKHLDGDARLAAAHVGVAGEEATASDALDEREVVPDEEEEPDRVALDLEPELRSGPAHFFTDEGF